MSRGRVGIRFMEPPGVLQVVARLALQDRLACQSCGAHTAAEDGAKRRPQAIAGGAGALIY